LLNDEVIQRMANREIENSLPIDSKEFHLHRTEAHGATADKCSTKVVRRYRCMKQPRKTEQLMQRSKI
jgi:hypothetical protein